MPLKPLKGLKPLKSLSRLRNTSKGGIHHLAIRPLGKGKGFGVKTMRHPAAGIGTGFALPQQPVADGETRN